MAERAALLRDAEAFHLPRPVAADSQRRLLHPNDHDTPRLPLTYLGLVCPQSPPSAVTALEGAVRGLRAPGALTRLDSDWVTSIQALEPTSDSVNCPHQRTHKPALPRDSQSAGPQALCHALGPSPLVGPVPRGWAAVRGHREAGGEQEGSGNSAGGWHCPSPLLPGQVPDLVLLAALRVHPHEPDSEAITAGPGPLRRAQVPGGPFRRGRPGAFRVHRGESVRTSLSATRTLRGGVYQAPTVSRRKGVHGVRPLPHSLSVSAPCPPRSWPDWALAAAR